MKRPFRMRIGRAGDVMLGVAGFLLILVAWQLVAYVGQLPSVSAPIAVAGRLYADGWTFYAPNLSQTLFEASVGWLWGNAIALVLAALIAILPWAERPVLQLALTGVSIPLIAIGPILAITFHAPTPQIIMAAIGVTFTTLVGALVGLRNVDATMLDIVRAGGGTRMAALLKVRIPAALPALFDALLLTPTAAILGAILGEYLGGSRGLGVAFITAGQSLQIDRVWGIAVVAAVMCGIGYGVIALARRLVVRWHAERPVEDAPTVGPAKTPIAGIIRSTISGLTTVAAIVGAWVGFLAVFHVSPFFGKTPIDVVAYLAADQQRLPQLGVEALITLRDAGLGMAAGLCAAFLGAVLFQQFTSLRMVFLPGATALRSVPLVILTPLIVVIFGRDLVAIAVIGAIVTFFPTLVILSAALREAPTGSLELIDAFGGSRGAQLMKVRLPNAMPALFGAIRISAPLALVGALVAEWLATGQGLGYTILTAASVSDYSGLWARVVLITLGTVAIYKLTEAVERSVRRRFAATD